MGDSISVYELIKSLTIVDIAAIILSLIIGLICLAGIIFAVIRRKQHNFVSIITIILLLLMAVNFGIVPIARIYTAEYLAAKVFRDDTMENEIIKTKGKLTDEDKNRIFQDKATKLAMYNRGTPSVFSVIELLIQIVLVILILVAIFRGRTNKIDSNKTTEKQS